MNQKWNKEKVVLIIKKLHQSGEKLNTAHIRKSNPSLFYATKTHFKSWRKAIEAAGLKYSKIKSNRKKPRLWGKEAVIEAIEVLNQKGENLNLSNIRSRHSALFCAARKYCGSWEKAVTAAGIDYSFVKLQPRKKEIWSKDKIIAIIKEKHSADEKLNCSFAQKNNVSLYGAACVYFGSWKKAIEAAGLKYSQIRIKERTHPRWSIEIIIRTIKERYQAGEKINSDYIQKNRPDLYGAGLKYFGSWGKAIEAAGLNYNQICITRPHSWTKNEIIRAIRKRKRSRLPINAMAVYKQDPTLYDATRRCFGKNGWSKAMRKAGYNPKELDPRRIWSKHRVVKEIRKLKRQKIPLYGNYLKITDIVGY